jgi:hypothetical protein
VVSHLQTLAQLTGNPAKAVVVPVEYAQDFDIDPNRHWFVSPNTHNVSYAGYPAHVQAMHQLHCLDYIRQGLYYNNEYYRSIHSIAWLGGPDPTAKHLAHCVDSLRQLIMCEADTRLAPYNKNGSPDFAITKSCRNFEAVRDFAIQHQWEHADSLSSVDDNHQGIRAFVNPEWSAEERWRGY